MAAGRIRHAGRLIAVALLWAWAAAAAGDAPTGPAPGSLQMRDVPRVAVPVDAEGVARRLSQAIAFETVSHEDPADDDLQAFRDFHAFLEQAYPKVHASLRRELLGAPHRLSLLYTWAGSDPSLPPIVLLAHQDVVPADPATLARWTHPPFSGAVADGFVWGRGALDDKGMLLAILEAAEALLAEGFRPTRTLLLAFGQDEEVGGLGGMAAVVEALRARGLDEVAMVVDEGLPLTRGLVAGLQAPAALIGVAEKGYLSLKLEVEGPGGHSAAPPDETVIGILAAAIARLEAAPFAYRITEPVRLQYRFLGPELPAEQREAARAVALGGKGDSEGLDFLLDTPGMALMLRTTTAPTLFEAGVGDNVLPKRATAVVNFRLLQGDSVRSATRRVRETLDDPRVALSVFGPADEPSPVADAFGPEFELLQKTVRQVWGEADPVVVPLLSPGETDSRHFASLTPNIYRFTAVRVGSAADVGRWHSIDERVGIEALAESVAFFTLLIRNAETLAGAG